jgi:hypothetical protein
LDGRGDDGRQSFGVESGSSSNVTGRVSVKSSRVHVGIDIPIVVVGEFLLPLLLELWAKCRDTDRDARDCGQCKGEEFASHYPRRVVWLSAAEQFQVLAVRVRVDVDIIGRRRRQSCRLDALLAALGEYVGTGSRVDREHHERPSLLDPVTSGAKSSCDMQTRPNVHMATERICPGFG